MESRKGEAQQWAQETFGAAQLGDPRRTKRLVTLAAQMAEDPEGSLPRQTRGNWSDLKAAYRLLRAEGVTHQALSEPSWQHTQELAQQEAEVLLLHDDTELDYGYRPAREGLGPIGNGSHQGLFVHSVLAVVPLGSHERILGLATQQPWVRQPAPRQPDGRKQTSRQRRLRERESQGWWRSVKQAGHPGAGTRWIHVGDRYADMLPFLRTCQNHGTQFVVRAAHNRRLGPAPAEPAAVKYLLDEVKGWPAKAKGVVDVASEHERRARQAQVNVSWGQVTLVEMDSHGRPLPHHKPLQVQVVRVWEPDPPSKEEGQRAFVPTVKHGHGRRKPQETASETVEPLEWILLTSLEVTNEEQAWKIIEYYQARWIIEEFHRGLKSGCHLEWARLREERSLENLLAICSPLAVRLLQLRDLARQHPDEPAIGWVPLQEVQVVAAQARLAVETMTVRHFVRQVAQLGGFLGRKSDGEPGWQTLWQGWMRVRWMVAGMQLAPSAASPASDPSP